MTKINGLFFDYDGTISPLEVSRQQSRVLPHLEKLLNFMNRFIPVGIITSKDLSFIVPRTLFAHAWAAIAGLEMKIGSQLFTSQGIEEILPHLQQALIFAKQHIREGVVIEEKRDYSGQPLAFCVDWRQVKNIKEARSMSSQILHYCRDLPLKIIEYPRKPFIDVFPCFIDKGQALQRLRDNIVLSGRVLYMGDSMTDNAAFRAADISIGVTNGKRPVDLDCDYWMDFNDVAYFLSALFKEQFNFSTELPGIK
jgi:trehalose-phosphatase